ncbi:MULTISPECIES: aldolase [Paenibacillus]|uniref:Aldolase n=1 Tax=Paenibacillus lautus TaxID=1401 RepID=A0A1R1B4L8_PAELA|nr:aldolase [Paenibacillus lautus]OME93902.1 aldolase [Paenibacillus lautus]
MLQTFKPTAYKAFGFSIHSDIPLPELQPVVLPDAFADIVIRYADLTERWLGRPDKSNKTFLCTKDMVMFRVPELAVFAIEGGTTISVSPEKGAAEDKIRLYVLGSCMGALLMQRKILPLHGSAVVIDHKAYAFIGHSGHGKSTLASAFLQKGYQLVTDDVIAVTLDQQNTPYVTPAYPQQKLWQESLEVFGMDSRHFRPLFDRETKFAIPVTSQFSNKPLPLAGIFELVKTDCRQLHIRAVDKLEKLPLLHRHTYRNQLLSGSGLTKWHFDITARMSGSMAMYQIQRPLNEHTVHQLTALVLDTISE